MQQKNVTANRVLQALDKSGLQATPQNYRLWHAHLSGHHPALSQDLEDVFRKDGRITQLVCADLYEKHFAHQLLQESVVDMLDSFSLELDDRLKNLRSLLGEADEAIPDKALLADLFSLNRSLCEHTQSLDAQLLHASRFLVGMDATTGTGDGQPADPATGFMTRAAFERELPQRCLISHRQGTPISVLLLDFAELAGQPSDTCEIDEIACRLGAVILDCVRGADLVSRYSDQQFAIMLPRRGMDAAYELANEIRAEWQRVQNDKTPYSHPSALIAAIGQFTFPEESASLMIRIHDQMREAKKSNSGRLSHPPGERRTPSIHSLGA